MLFRSRHALLDALPTLLGSTAPVVAALLLGAAAFQLTAPPRLRPLRGRAPRLAILPRPSPVPAIARPDQSCCTEKLGDEVAAMLLDIGREGRKAEERPPRPVVRK